MGAGAAGALLAAGAPVSWLAACLAVAVALLIMAWPTAAAVAAGLAVPFGGAFGVDAGPGRATAAPLVVAAGATGVVWRRLRQRAPAASTAAARRASPLLPAALALITVQAMATALAPDTAAAAVEAARWAELVLAAAVGYAAGATRRGAHVAAAGVLTAGALAALHGLAQSVSGSGPPAFAIMGGALKRAYGPFGQPNPFGAYMNMVWPLGAALIAGAVTPWRRRSVPLWLGVAGGATAAAVAAALALSWSRGAWLGAAAAAMAMAAMALARLATRLRSSLSLAVASVLAGLALAVATVIVLPGGGGGEGIGGGMAGRLASIGSTFAAWGVADAEVTDANYATIERVAHWEAAFAMWADRPWLGQGPGHYELVYDRYRLPQWPEALGHAHSAYLHTLAETGLAGLVTLLLALGAATVLAVRLVARAADAWPFCMGLALLGTLAAVSVHGLVDFPVVHDMTVQLGLLVGLAAAAGRTEP
jgi:O-antigen ligase